MEEKKYHFVGIKGAGMSALALILHQQGFYVQGSDTKMNFFTQNKLEEEGIPIFSFHKKNIFKGLTIIVGNAFSQNHEEVIKGKKLKLEIISYNHFLSKLVQKYNSIAVTGSHGKTSTTGWLSHVFSETKSTNYLIGDGTGHGRLDAEYFIFEACEYREHFLAYHPDYVIITSIDFDHPDYFTNINDVFATFQRLTNQVKKGIICFGDEKYTRKLKTSVPIHYYGTDKNNDFKACNIIRTSNSSIFDVYKDNKFIGKFDLPIFGKHSINNILSVIVMAYLEGLDMKVVSKRLNSFSGTQRRFQEKKIYDMIIIDDYAHHPNEIKATIDATRQKYPKKEIIIVFQPHTFTRTAAFIGQFVEALDLADYIFLCNIFGSIRENKTKEKISIEDLRNKVAKGGEIINKENISILLNFQQSIIIFMGAGNIDQLKNLYENLLKRNRYFNLLN